MLYANAIVVLVYLVAMVALGIYLKRFVHKEEDFFVAGRRLNKWVIAGTIMATNIAAIYLVGPAGTAYSGGGVSLLLIAWSGNMIAAVSALIFVPRLRRLRLTTVSSLLEERYGLWLRLMPAAFWMIYYSLFSGNAIYTLSTVLQPLTEPFFPGSDPKQMIHSIILVVGGVVILYCAFSGSVGVAYTATIQAALIVLGGLILLPLSLKAIGGVSGFVEKVPAEAFVFWKSGPDAAWPAWKDIIMICLIGLPYWCTGQNMLQRTFAGKSVREASRGLLLAALLTGPITLAYIIPGICASVLYADDPVLQETPDLVLPHMIIKLLPAGLGGLFVAALLAASNSTASALLNSLATLGEHDFYRRFIPGKSTSHYLWVARAITLLCGALGLIFAFNVDRLGGILRANFSIACVFDPPIFLIVAAGLFWRRINAWGAGTGLLAGIAFNSLAWAGLIFASETIGENGERIVEVLPLADRAIWCFPVTIIAMVAGTYLGDRFRPMTEEARARRDALMDRMHDKEAGHRVFTKFSAGTASAGYAVAIVALVTFVWFSFFEEALPGPKELRILWYMGMMLLFICGCLLAVPLFMSRDGEREPGVEGAAEKGSLESSLLHRIVGNGWFWLAVYAAAGALVLVLYFR